MSVIATQRAALKRYQRQCRQPRSWPSIQQRNYVSMENPMLLQKFDSNFHWLSLSLRTGRWHHIFVIPGPENVKNVQVTAQTEISITLKWEKVQNSSTYMLQYEHNGTIKQDITSTAGAWVTHEISDLTPGTKYNFTIITKFEGSESPGYTLEAVTSKRDWSAWKILSFV